LMVVTGETLKLTTATDLVTARDSLEWYDQKQIAVARGNAVAVRNGKTIKADILTAYMVKTKPPDGKTPVRAAKATPPQGGKPSAIAASAPGGARQRVQGLFIRDDEARGKGGPGGISGHKPASGSDRKP